MNGALYGLSVSGNIIVQSTYKIKCDAIVANETGKLYIGDELTTEIHIGQDCNVFVNSNLNYITKNNIDVVDPLIRLNKGGVSNFSCGIEVEMNNLVSDYIKTSTNGNNRVIKSNSGAEYIIATSNDIGIINTIFNNYTTTSAMNTIFNDYILSTTTGGIQTQINTINNKITDGVNSIYTKYIACAGMVDLHKASLVQGAYLSWNTSNGVGETNFIDLKDGISGGFYFYNCASTTVNSGSLIAQINIVGDITCNKLNIVSSEINFNSTTSIINLNTAKNNYIQCINNSTVFWSNNSWLFWTYDGLRYPFILLQNGYMGLGSINPTEMLHFFKW